MKLSDYIVQYLIEKGITDVFGYPGGMVTHLMESFCKYKDQISAHVTYHEQGAAFAACGYAQTSGKPGVAYATSGPGATNLITGICNAYFDSIPCVFITGQVNTFEAKERLGVRQRGFQETEIISMVSGVTKYAIYVEESEKIKYYLDKAFSEATTGRKGPVLLDIPMNVFRSSIDVEMLKGYEENIVEDNKFDMQNLFQNAMNDAKRPLFLFGNGIKTSALQNSVKELISKWRVPVVTSMIAFDVIAGNDLSLGFVGAYGNREANFAVAKSDLIIAIGTRLDIRQVGAKRENFAPNSKIIRIDIDSGELEYKVHEDEIQVKSSAEEIIEILKLIELKNDYSMWRNVCYKLKQELKSVDSKRPNDIISLISDMIPEEATITTDVGQNQIWVAQSFNLKYGQQVLFSGGHGAMGYSFPAAIGSYYGNGRQTTICFNGDGGFQMNIQELQYIAREQLPLKIIILNNNALGMIRHFQEMYFDNKFFQTKPEGGYNAPDFSKVADAYGIRSLKIENVSEIEDTSIFTDDKPLLLEIMIKENTYVFPKLEFGKPNQDQEPLLSREKYQYLMDL